jgi:hypothetical protein
MKYKRNIICFAYSSFSFSLQNCVCCITQYKLSSKTSIFAFYFYFSGRAFETKWEGPSKECIKVVHYFSSRSSFLVNPGQQGLSLISIFLVFSLSSILGQRWQRTLPTVTHDSIWYALVFGPNLWRRLKQFHQHIYCSPQVHDTMQSPRQVPEFQRNTVPWSSEHEWAKLGSIKLYRSMGKETSHGW